MFRLILPVIIFLLLLNSKSFSEAEDKYADIRETLENCNSCHGPAGASTDGEFPILAGQEFFYLYVQMKDFKKGLRKNELMSSMVAEFERPMLKKIAQYYSEQTWPNIGFKGDPKKIAKGKTAGDAGQCVACHLGSYTGNSRVPRLAGQHPEYLEKTMLDMKHKDRNNAPAVSSLLTSFSEDDIKAMAEFLGNL